MPPPRAIIDSSKTGSGWVYLVDRDALPDARPLLPVTIDSSPYVLFQDDEGELGLVGRHCPHRGADLCFGRLEDNGIRCPFHGWHFDRSGQCIEQPAEPDGSNMASAIKLPVVPLRETDGRVFAWVGEGAPDQHGHACTAEVGR